MAEVRLEKVWKAFGGNMVIRGVDLTVDPGAFVVFVGPSGCGKSTLLRLIAGLEEVSRGNVWIGGRDVTELPPYERGIAMVFQSYALYPHMTVYDNMAFGLRLAREGRAAVDARVREAARILQIEPLLERKPRQLSGGQRQRVAIGRAITRNPEVFLFDEPLSNLDAALRVQMRIEIARLHRQLGATMIYVTHDQVEAMTLADRIAVLDAGVLRQFAAPLELYHHPADRFVATFIGSPRMNLLPCRAVGEAEGGVMVEIAEGTVLATTTRAEESAEILEIGLRPEHLLCGGGGDAGIEGEILAVERLGGESFVHLSLAGDRTLVAKAPGGIEARPGTVMRIGIPAGAAYLFDRDGRCLPRPAFD